MSDDRVPLKNPWVAAGLAFLLPGMGHVYQGRMFKAGLYAVCILGTFFAGMAMGDWQPVYYRMDRDHSRFSYFSQVWVGLPALPAVIQKQRYDRGREIGPLESLDSESLESDFSGVISTERVDGRLSGSLRLERKGKSVEGVFQGTLEDGTVVNFRLSSPMKLQQQVYPSRKREFSCQVVDDDGRGQGYISGSIPRSFVDWCEVPLGGPKGDGTFDNEALAAAHSRLGKWFDLASVFTWIAGLLNVLAIWDAFEGPAYGYGDDAEDGEGEAQND